MKKLILNYHFWVIGILGMVFTSCSTKFKTIEENGSKKIYNIKYGDHQQQRMDVFLPANYSKETPVVMIVHGGGWKFGYKEHMKMIQNFLFENNIPSINIDYRLMTKEIRYQEQVEDISKAISKSNELSESWNLKPSNYILLGESAGGHLALLYGYQNPQEIKKLISMSSPTDLYSERYQKSKYYKISKGVFQKVVGEKFDSNLEAFKKASPVANVSNIPTLIFQGDRDFLVNKSQGLALDSVLTSKNIPHKLIFMKDSGHVPRFVKRKRDAFIFPNILTFIKEQNN
ncbi:alpha/beta hydrolase [Kaistella jeonii]|uniref:Esterase n=1 Tax=Kaistella jeonii TaxID=266749 RepID=A0A0C1F969_9FLAO|nr:alpha/beta hydrolase [Kaistella jeonii]KIA88453.1 esterase [Kaistella jeonii]SFC17413.1 Acetyl esterase/lipase [Kaistella jeonii]VEI95419.1 acetyl esterase [Kaistella jeonii]